ncbi:MAG TPA: Fe-S cluster assembly protein SufD [Steroidobacteraceae bacterium]|nr:Fe-S cluster assembly protein SufD [Steroidobacteraceae bacterium]
MSPAATALSSRVAAEYATLSESALSPFLPGERRRGALARLREEGLPTARDDNWRYANLRALERVKFLPAPQAADTPELLAGITAALPPPVEDFERHVFADGRYVAALSALPAPRGAASALVHSLAQSEPLAAGDTATADERLALLSDVFASDGAGILVPANRATPARIELIFVAGADASAGASYPRIELKVADGAQLELIERHLSLADAASFVNCSVRVSLGRGATLTHYRVQQLGGRSIWFDTLQAALGDHARYQLHCVQMGAQTGRSTQRISLAGAAASLGLYAVAAADRQQVHDTYALVEHAAPRTRTEELFRGIAAGRSRVAFNGKIVVRPGAQGADSSQSLRGLLAGPESEIDVRPQLEIYTDDVRCNHGATAGKLDDAMLFYLLTRGIDPEVARRLLKWAFIEDAVSRIAVPALRRQLEASLAGALPEAEALKELLA